MPALLEEETHNMEQDTNQDTDDWDVRDFQIVDIVEQHIVFDLIHNSDISNNNKHTHNTNFSTETDAHKYRLTLAVTFGVWTKFKTV